MKGCRIIDCFGYIVIKNRKKEKAVCTLTLDYMKWQYDLKSMDWLNEDYESRLTAFVRMQDWKAFCSIILILLWIKYN
jgi:hypothetical protein